MPLNIVLYIFLVLLLSVILLFAFFVALYDSKSIIF